MGLASGVAKWMKEGGRGEFADQFLKVLPRLGDRGTAHGADGTGKRNGPCADGPHEDMPRGLQSYLSVMFTDDGGLEVTTYLVPVLSETAWVV